MNKPRIFIAMHYLEIGGAESALIGLLQSLDPKRVDVDLFLYDHRGEMMKFIPSWINILPPSRPYTYIERPLIETIKRGLFGVAYGRLMSKFLFGFYKIIKKPKDNCAIFGYVGHCVTPFLPSLKHYGQYDLAISFLSPHDIVLRKVDAKKKICWIHTDYTKIDVNTKLEFPVWNGYDNIISISSDVTRTFCEVFPQLKNKIVEIENIIPSDFILSRALEIVPYDMPDEPGVLKLLTIGRFSFPKKMEEIPIICKGLLDKGLLVKWYIIGYGSVVEERKIHDAIFQSDVAENVIILGKRVNPYAYIKACDWYLQPSRYEGKSITVREAQILGKPVIITDYPTSGSQVKNGIDGYIVNMEVTQCTEDIYKLLTNDPYGYTLIEYISTHEFGNESEAEKVYELLPSK